MKQILSLFFILAVIPSLFAQTDKSVSKAIETFQAGKIDKGIKMMEKIVDKDPSDYTWDLLVQMHYERFSYAQQNASNAFVALFGESMGAKMDHKDYTSPAVCFDDFINTCLEANLYSQSPSASQYLRNFFIDYNPDTAIDEEAQKAFNRAENSFMKKDYAEAKKEYLNALSIEPQYFKATIYLGDAYYFMDMLDSATYYFGKGVEWYPDLLEPRKYLVDALANSDNTDKAIQASYEAIFVYPDETMFIKLAKLYKRQGKRFNKHWTRRGCEVNTINKNMAMANDPIWEAYQSARDEIKQYCDSNGIIVKSTSLTNSKYLEVYSWEKMLASLEKVPAELAFAKKMQEAGYLDCYVFTSVFHFDLYDQYKDFVNGNRDRIKEYFEKYLIE